MLFVRDLPPVTSAGLQVTEPSIYFGELSNDYVIVRTNAREFHYPRGRRQRVDAVFGPRRRADRIAAAEAAVRAPVRLIPRSS